MLRVDYSKIQVPNSVNVVVAYIYIYYNHTHINTRIYTQYTHKRYRIKSHPIL